MSVRRFLLLFVGAIASSCMVILLIAHNGYSVQRRGQSDAAYSTAAPVQLPLRDVMIRHTQPLSSLTLPCQIAGTSLCIEQFVYYEGDHFENDRIGYVVNTAAILLRNTGDTGLLNAKVILEQGSVELVFEADMLPPGETVLLLERDAKTVLEPTFTACYGYALADRQVWLSEDILAEPTGKGDLVITNLTDRAVEHLCIYYRTRYSGGSFYLGGRTHLECVSELLPGERRQISPEAYAGEFSEIVRICTDPLNGE